MSVWELANHSPGSQPGGLAAAFRALARGGVDSIAVEPIAAELGATKGSFYWHFKNRDSLVAALDEWSGV